MPHSFNNICSRLSSLSDSRATTDAQSWLESNPDSKNVPSLIQKIEQFSSNEESIAWCSEWLSRHPQHMEGIENPIWNAHSTISLKYQATVAHLSEASGEAISELQTLVQNDHVIELSQQWLDKYAQANRSHSVLHSLLRAAPSSANCLRARKWMDGSRDKFQANSILSLLIEYDCQPDLVQSALSTLRQSTEATGEAFEARAETSLANALRNFVEDDRARDEALAWWKSTLKSKHARYAVRGIYSALPNEDIADLVVDWLFKNPHDEYNLITWITLLIKNCTESVMTACWNWLDENKKHKDWEGIYGYLLERGGKSFCELPTPAIKKAWQLFKSGDLAYGEYLLKVDRNNRTAKTIFSFAKDYSTSDMTLGGIVAGLLEVDPSEETIRFATQWVLANQKKVFKVRRTLEQLMTIAPTESLTSITKELAKKLTNQLGYVETLVLLIRTTSDEWSISVARKFLALENRSGFRNLTAESSGKLLFALLDKGNADASTADCALRWLRLCGHQYRPLAQQLRAKVVP